MQRSKNYEQQLIDLVRSFGDVPSSDAKNRYSYRIFVGFLLLANSDVKNSAVVSNF